MSYPCVRGKPDCDGCMMCEKPAEVIGYCESCREPIHAGEEHYDIEGDLLHDDCLSDWASKYRRNG